MSIKYKNALVTGGAGFIGSHLVNALVSVGCQVSVLDNLSSGFLSNLEHINDQIKFYEGETQDRDILEKAVKNCDIIFHLGGMVSVPRSVAQPMDSALNNEMGTLNILESARNQQIKRVIFASSCAVYGDDPELPKHENLSTNPLSPYALQKIIGEQYLKLYNQLYGLETISLRYFNVFGPRQDANSAYSGVISLFMSSAVSGKEPVIFGDGNQFRDFIFVKDVVRANLLAADTEKANGAILNIGTGRKVSINKLWEMISSLSGANQRPVHESPRRGDIEKSLADIRLARKEIDFAPKYSFDEGLEMTFQWYQSQV